ncbi:MAG: hypothetical protein ACKVOO_06110 [Burkholderiaceae bacterium]
MIKPPAPVRALLHLMAHEPDALAEHAQAYAELAAAELEHATSAWKRRCTFMAAALCCGGVALVLAGVALMLWAVLPPDQIRAPWALVIAPLVPAACAAVFVMLARQTGGFAIAMDRLLSQMKADMAMLQESSKKVAA